MAVDYIHYIIPYSETALLGNLATFFYFGITLLPLKKKSLANLTSNSPKSFDVFQKEVETFFPGRYEKKWKAK